MKTSTTQSRSDIPLSAYSADAILEQIEAACDALREAEERHGREEASHKAFEASATLGIKETENCSVTEAEKRVRTTVAWQGSMADMVTYTVSAADAKRRYQIALLRAEMWRSEQATLRAVG